MRTKVVSGWWWLFIKGDQSHFETRREEEEQESASPIKSGKKKSSSWSSSSRNRTLSVESCSSMTSDSDDDARPKSAKVDSVFDDFDLEEKPAASAPEIPEPKNRNGELEAEKILTSFFSGKDHDQLPLVRRPPTTTLASSPSPSSSSSAAAEPKRFTKLSQKERKRLSMMGQSMKPVDEKEGSPAGQIHS